MRAKANVKKKLLLFCLLGQLAFCVQAQEPVFINIIPPTINPYDCVEVLELYTGTFIAVDSFILRFPVTLEGKISYGTNFGNRQLIAEGKSNSFLLPSINTMISAQNAEILLSPINYTFYDKDLERSYFNTGCLVPGFYEICLNVKTRRTTALPEMLGQTCYFFEIQSTSPLLLVSPFNHTEMNTPLPLFTWTPIVSRRGQAEYRTKVVEILGNQTGYEAFRSNPLYYQQEGLFTNVLLYPVAARPFEPCRNYAWQVETIAGKQTIQQSEIWTFHTTCEVEDKLEKERKKKKKSRKELITVAYYELKDIADRSFVNISEGVLKFKLDHPFDERKSLNFSLYDDSGKRLSIKEKPLNVESQTNAITPGLNLLELDLTNAGLRDGALYLLELTELKIPKYLRFEYKSY